MSVMGQQVLLQNATVADSGWIDLSAFDKGMSLIFEGIVTNDTLDVRVANDPQKPADTEIGVIYGSAVTADGIVKIAECYRWLKVRRTAITGGGKVDVSLAGARPAFGGVR